MEPAIEDRPRRIEDAGPPQLARENVFVRAFLPDVNGHVLDRRGRQELDGPDIVLLAKVEEDLVTLGIRHVAGGRACMAPLDHVPLEFRAGEGALFEGEPAGGAAGIGPSVNPAGPPSLPVGKLLLVRTGLDIGVLHLLECLRLVVQVFPRRVAGQADRPGRRAIDLLLEGDLVDFRGPRTVEQADEDGRFPLRRLREEIDLQLLPLTGLREFILVQRPVNADQQFRLAFGLPEPRRQSVPDVRKHTDLLRDQQALAIDFIS